MQYIVKSIFVTVFLFEKNQFINIWIGALIMNDIKNNCKIIFVGNYKGGVGKTTTVLNFAEYFSNENKNVLVLDIDPQSSSEWNIS